MEEAAYRRLYYVEIQINTLNRGCVVVSCITYLSWGSLTTTFSYMQGTKKLAEIMHHTICVSETKVTTATCII